MSADIRVAERFQRAARYEGSDESLEIVAGGLALLLAQNHIVSNPFFDEKEIKKYLQLRRQFQGQFVQACQDLADAFEAGHFGPEVRPAIPALRAIGALNVKQEQQALRQMVKAFRGLKHLSYADVENPKLIKLIWMSRKLEGDSDSIDIRMFLENLVRVQALPAPLRTFLRKVMKLPMSGALVETTNPGAWFDMPDDRKQGLRELGETLQREKDEIWEKYKDDPDKRVELYKTNIERTQKLQNIAGVNIGIITKQDDVPLATVLKQEAKLDSDGPTEYTRLKIEAYVRDVGMYRAQRKSGEPVPREIGKLLTDLKKARTFPTMRRVVADAVDRQLLGQSAVEDIDNIIDRASKNRAIREGKPLVPLQFEPMTADEFQVRHDTGEVEFDAEYTDDERKVLLGRVSRAISDLESVYGKGFCGKHAKKLAFKFNKFEGTATAHYFTWDDRRVWQPRVTFGPEYEGVLAHELSHYLEDLLAYRRMKQNDPDNKLLSLSMGGPGNLLGNTGVPLSNYGAGAPYADKTREALGQDLPEMVEFIDAVLSTEDYKRWGDMLGTAYDTAMPLAIKALTGMSQWDLPKDHPYHGLIEKVKYRSELPPEVREETEKQYARLMDGDTRKLSYYISTTEVWARMCEQYVYNKLIDAGISNPWLTHMAYSDDDVFMDEKTFDAKVRPVMDRLFERLKGRSLLASYVERIEPRMDIEQRVVDRVLADRVAARYKDKKKTEAGNTVYMYSERQIKRRNTEKAKRIQKLSGSIKKLRAKVKKDLKSSDPETSLTALAVALMDHTYERVGNEKSADDGHFGVTGWQRKHVSFKPDGAFIKYVGKSGVKQEKKVTDAAIRSALKSAYDGMEGDDSEVLSWKDGKITAEKVNAYLEPFDITAKDIRGLHANEEMRVKLKSLRAKGKLPEDKKEREKKLKEEFKEALELTAECVGHEASTLKTQYLVPGLEESYLKDGTIIDKLGSLVYDDGRDAYVDTETGEAGPNGPANPEFALPESGHYQVLCRECGSVIRQCRCDGDKVTLYEEAFSCPVCNPTANF